MLLIWRIEIVILSVWKLWYRICNLYNLLFQSMEKFNCCEGWSLRQVWKNSNKSMNFINEIEKSYWLEIIHIMFVFVRNNYCNWQVFMFGLFILCFLLGILRWMLTTMRKMKIIWFDSRKQFDWGWFTKWKRMMNIRFKMNWELAD